MNFKKKGINEISILSESKEIIAHTNPKNWNIYKKLKELDFLIIVDATKNISSGNLHQFK